MSSGSANSTPSLAASLPHEVLDHILSYRFAKRFDLRHASAEEEAELSGLSVVCKAWCGPTQRHYFRQLFLSSIEEVRGLMDVVERNPGLGGLVRRLYLWVREREAVTRVRRTQATMWTVGDFNRLMAMLPNVTFLSLRLNDKSPKDFSELEQLPSLTEVEFSIYSEHRVRTKLDVSVYWPILSKTPNLTTLRLATMTPTRRLEDIVHSVELPSLTRLALLGNELCQLVHDKKLFTESTLSQIDDLELSTLARDRIPAITIPPPASERSRAPVNLLRRIGKQIKTLTFGRGGTALYDDELLRECPNATTLIARRPFTLATFPPNLSTIKYQPGWLDSCKWMIEETIPDEYNRRVPGMNQNAERWKNVKRLEIDGGAPTEKIKQSLLERGVELFIDGIIYTSSSLT